MISALPYILIFALGVALGGFIVFKFNPKDYHYTIDKLRAKKGGIIDVAQNNEQPKQEKKRKLFKRKNK